MKKETLARSLVIGLVILAIAIPFGGQWLSRNSQPAAIELHARMAENGGWSITTIQATVGVPIHLHITSDDVIYGFSIGKSDQPALEIKPGEFTDTILIFDQPGEYTFYCDRWCGRNHWRMRGVIDVTAPAGSAVTPVPPDPQPLFLKLSIDIDSPALAQITPAGAVSAERGAQLTALLPADTTQRDIYLATSPVQLWLRLRAEPDLARLSDQDLWDAVAWVWHQQATPAALLDAQKRFATNCAACHGETGKGDGVMVQGLPVWGPSSAGGMAMPATGSGSFRPPDFTDPRNLLGASPALLEGKIIRGGMGTGMPYWGPIFTAPQIDALVSFLYTFAWGQ